MANSPALEPRKRGPKTKVIDARDRQIAELQRNLEKVTRRAERAEALVEVPRKPSQLLEFALPSPREET